MQQQTLRTHSVGVPAPARGRRMLPWQPRRASRRRSSDAQLRSSAAAAGRPARNERDACWEAHARATRQPLRLLQRMLAALLH
jgi:hypothetical protein